MEESDQFASKRVQSADLCCVTGDNEGQRPLSCLWPGSGPPVEGPATPWSLTNILHVQQQIKTDQADCYRSYTALGCLSGPRLCLLITPSSEQLGGYQAIHCHGEMGLL